MGSLASPGPQTDDDVARVLAGFSSRYQPRQMTRLGSGLGFSGARIWRIETDVGPFCLRAMAADAVDPRRLTGLHRLLAHVESAGVDQVAVPAPRIDHSTFAVVGRFVWQLEPWKPGVADFAARPSAVRLEAALECLARWHRAAATFRPVGDETIWFGSTADHPSPGIGERLARIGAWGADRRRDVRRRLEQSPQPALREAGKRILELFGQRAPAIAAQLQVAAEVRIAIQPCLRDIWHDHVLFTGDAVTGLIDANACRSESAAGDLARLLGSLVGDDQALWQTGIEAYERVRPLSINETGLIEIFDRSGVLLSGLTWLDWLLVEQRPFDEPERIQPRIEGILRRLERMG